jgi:hypothetical protein
MYRYRKTLKEFREQQNQSACPLCDPAQLLIIKEFEHSLLVHNRYPYDLWEGREVIEHRMIMPKRHLTGFGEFSSAEKHEIFEQIAQHEAEGFDVYARSVHSTERSVRLHQHTHLIKVQPHRPKFILFLLKPYLLLKR